MRHGGASLGEGGVMTAEPTWFMGLPEVLKRVGLSRATVYRLINANAFPAPHKIGRRSVWAESEIRTWQRSILAE